MDEERHQFKFSTHYAARRAHRVSRSLRCFFALQLLLAADHRRPARVAPMEVANVQFLEILKGLIEFLGEDDSREFIRLMSSAMTYFRNKMDALKEQEE